MQLEQTKDMTLRQQVSEAFEETYGEAPSTIVRVPGRVNIMGGHTGYTGGYVLSVTVDRHTMIALRPLDDGHIRAQMLGHDTTVEFDAAKLSERDGTGDLLKSAALALGTEGYVLRGWEGVVGTDIPADADLAADASMMLALLRAFAETSRFDFDPQPMANIADKGYTDYVGSRSILPDFYTLALSEPGSAMLLDAQSLNIEHIPFSLEGRLLLLETGLSQDAKMLSETIYQRVDECAAAARNYKVGHLRDLSMSRFEKDVESLEENVAARARHFLTENGRTILAGEMLRSGALSTVGKLMSDSHVSLREEYGMSIPEMDMIVECAGEQPNVFGARWAGFGGAGVALVRDFSADTVSKLVPPCYKKKTKMEGTAIILKPAGVVEVL